jgi:hypothetical protein
MAGGIEDDRYTYDLPLIDGGARRPNLHDLGGDEMADDDPAPQKFVQPTAALANGINRNLAGVNRMIGTARLWVVFDGADPVKTNAKGMGSQINTDSFQVLSQSTGVTTVEWGEGVLPPMEGHPSACLNDGPGMIWAKKSDVDPLQVIVFTYDKDGDPANLAFNVVIH